MFQKLFITVIILAAFVVTIVLVIQHKNKASEDNLSSETDGELISKPKPDGTHRDDIMQNEKEEPAKGANDFMEKAEKLQDAEAAWGKIRSKIDQLRDPNITDEKHKEVLGTISVMYEEFLEKFRDVHPQMSNEAIFNLSRIYQVLEKHDKLEKFTYSIVPDEKLDTQIKIEVINTYLVDLREQKEHQKALKYVTDLLGSKEIDEVIKGYLWNKKLDVLFQLEEYDEILKLVSEKHEKLSESRLDYDKYEQAELILWKIRCMDKQQKTEEELFSVKDEIDKLIEKINDEEMKERVKYISYEAARIIAARNIVVGKTAPSWTLKSIRDESEISLSDFAGRIVLLDFWSSWSNTCNQFMAKYLNKWAEKYKDTDLAIIGIGTNWRGDTSENQLEFLKAAGYDWLAVYDQDGKVLESYAVGGIPFVMIINREGKIELFDVEYEKIEKYLDENLLATDEPSDETSEDEAEEPTDETQEDDTEEPTDESTDETSEDEADEPTDETSEDEAEEPTDETSEDEAEETTDDENNESDEQKPENENNSEENSNKNLDETT